MNFGDFNFMKRYQLALFGLLLILMCGCQTGVKPPQPAKSQIEKIKIIDYGHALFSLNPDKVKEGLDSLSGEFHFFIGDKPDTLKVLQIRDFICDPFNRGLYEKSREIYPNPGFLEDGLTKTFGNIKTVYPGFKVPHVYTYISGLLYEYPVQYIDTVLVIGIDMFLGWNFEAYRAAALPVYLTRRMEPQNIIPECARQIAFSMQPQNFQPKTLLDQMIVHGKVLYAMDQFLPDTPDSLKIGYTKSQLAWASDNEASLWRLLIDQELLFKNSEALNTRFIQDGPFTPGLPQGSPAMLGRWLGWQIVRNYMKKNPGISLEQLFEQTDSQLILSESGYKPKK
jgi:hypothetical protein